MKDSQNKQNPNNILVSTKVSEDVRTKIREIARENEISISQTTRELLEEGIRLYDSENKSETYTPLAGEIGLK